MTKNEVLEKNVNLNNIYYTASNAPIITQKDNSTFAFDYKLMENYFNKAVKFFQKKFDINEIYEHEFNADMYPPVGITTINIWAVKNITQSGSAREIYGETCISEQDGDSINLKTQQDGFFSRYQPQWYSNAPEYLIGAEVENILNDYVADKFIDLNLDLFIFDYKQQKLLEEKFNKIKFKDNNKTLKVRDLIEFEDTFNELLQVAYDNLLQKYIEKTKPQEKETKTEDFFRP